MMCTLCDLLTAPSYKRWGFTFCFDTLIWPIRPIRPEGFVGYPHITPNSGVIVVLGSFWEATEGPAPLNRNGLGFSWYVVLYNRDIDALKIGSLDLRRLEKEVTKCELGWREGSERSGNNQSQKRAKKFGAVANPLKRLTRS
jgi:hypothetical protein